MMTAELAGMLRGAGAAGLGESDLLRRFARHHDEAAFEALLRRHGPMVWGVCRRVLGDPADIEDTFQATFIVFIRKAGTLDGRGPLANWLFGVARRLAQRARADRERRRAHERRAGAEPRPGPYDASRESLLGLLDSEVARLPDRFRAPVVLCELQGRTLREAAELLECPVGTVASRLARGRGLLARRLAGHGAVLGGAALAGGILPPRALAAGRAVLNGSVSPFALKLSQGVLNTMILTKLSLSLVVGVGLAVGFGGLPSYFARAEKPASDKSDKAAKKEVGASIRGHVKSVDADKNKLVLTVHTGTGKETTEKFLDLAAGARVYLEDATEKVNELPRGELSDLKEGTEVTAQLDAAGKKVIMVSARGPGLHATFKSAGQDTFVIETKGSDGPVEETITMVKGAKVLLHDGLSKEDKDQESELSKISAGSTVWLQLTVDRKRALSVRPQGTLHFATLRKLDSGNNSITVTVKENGQLVDKTFTLAKNAMTDTNIAEGGGVTVRMSLFNENIAVEVRARE